MRTSGNKNMVREYFYRVMGYLPSFIMVWFMRKKGYSVAEAVVLGNKSCIFGKSVSIMPKVEIGSNVLIHGDTILIGEGAIIGDHTKIEGESIKIGDHARLEQGFKFSGKSLELGDHVNMQEGCRVEGLSLFHVGEYCTFHEMCRIRGIKELVTGENCWFGDNVFINVHEPVHIGHNVGIGQDSMLWTHGFFAEELEGYPVKFGGITIENNVWITPRVIVQPGVKVGRSSIINTGALIAKDVPAHTLNAGIPAKPLVGEDKYRKKISVSEKIGRTVEVLRELLQSTYPSSQIGKNVFLFSGAERSFYIVVVKSRIPSNLDNIVKKDTLTDILFFCSRTRLCDKLLKQFPGTTIFNFENKTYVKQSTPSEAVVKIVLNDRYIRFVSRGSD